jgi:hypothetical protein
MQNLPAEKFDANSLGNLRQDEPMRKRRVRSIDLPIGRLCPERAEAYGLDYDSWRRSYEAALSVNLDEIRIAGEAWASKLKRQRKVRVTSNAGTDFTLKTKTLEPMIDDGIISRSDLNRDFLSASLPAGKLVCAVNPTSATGKVCFSDPVFLMGHSVKGLHLRFNEGKLIEWGADENADLLTPQLGQDNDSSRRIGWFSIGLNSAAKPCMLDNSIVKNDFGIGLGPHPLLEPTRARSNEYFEGTIGLVNVEILG